VTWLTPLLRRGAAAGGEAKVGCWQQLQSAAV